MKSLTWRSVAQGLMVALWLAVPFTTGELIDRSVVNASGAIRGTIAVGGWAIWAATLTAALIRRPVTLTLIRLAMSGATVAAVWSAVSAEHVSTIVLLFGVVVPTCAWLVSMNTTIGATYIDGASYGHERRFPLRPPVAILIGPAPLAWAAAIFGISVGPLLLASEQWLWGAAVTAVGVPASIGATRALHGLSRRWLVFVPAGAVVHDFMTTREPFLMMRNTIASFGAAPSDSDLDGADLLDATQRASGIVVMIELDKAVEAVPRAARGEVARLRLVNRVAIVPTRPGAAVAEARSRNIG